MKVLLLALVSSFGGIVFGNFAYQAMTIAPQWGVATERSFFQFVAIAMFIVIRRDFSNYFRGRR